MLKFFIKRPVTTIMFVLFFVILGVVSFPKMNIERSPSVDFPYVTVTFVYPGASSSEIETQVVKKAENAVFHQKKCVFFAFFAENLSWQT